MKILVTGGAGYIGSITAKKLLEEGHDVVVFDNLINGHKEAVSSELVVGDLLKKEDLGKLNWKDIEGVVHFAALALAGESMHKPYEYFENNIMGGLNLLEFMKNNSVKNIVFSSTCAVYGTPKKLPVSENEEKKPESVYGQSKLTFENILFWYDKLYGIKYINLRYFNAAGASLDRALGEEHKDEAHIIPNAIYAALGKIKEFSLYGSDYDTPDGTTIRDYIHVEDLAKVHINALNKLRETGESDSFNLGTGRGYSNRQVLEMVKKVGGAPFPVKISKRRQGDPAIIYADNRKAKGKLGFSPKYSDLETIVKTAWEYHKNKR